MDALITRSLFSRRPASDDRRLSRRSSDHEQNLKHACPAGTRRQELHEDAAPGRSDQPAPAGFMRRRTGERLAQRLAVNSDAAVQASRRGGQSGDRGLPLDGAFLEAIDSIRKGARTTPQQPAKQAGSREHGGLLPPNDAPTFWWATTTAAVHPPVQPVHPREHGHRVTVRQPPPRLAPSSTGSPTTSSCSTMMSVEKRDFDFTRHPDLPRTPSRCPVAVTWRQGETEDRVARALEVGVDDVCSPNRSSRRTAAGMRLGASPHPTPSAGGPEATVGHFGRFTFSLSRAELAGRGTDSTSPSVNANASPAAAQHTSAIVSPTRRCGSGQRQTRSEQFA